MTTPWSGKGPSPSSKIMFAIIGPSVDRSKSQALKEAGAVACLSKESAADELFNVIQRIMAARKGDD